MKILAISNRYLHKKTNQNPDEQKITTNFKGADSTATQNPIEDKKASEAIKNNFLSRISFSGHKENLSYILLDDRRPNYISGSSGAVHIRLTDPQKDLSTENIEVRTGNQVEANTDLIKHSSYYYPNSSIENTLPYRKGYVTDRVYFADPEETITDQTKKDHDYIVYDNRPKYPRLEEVKKNYFGFDYIPKEYKSTDNATDYGQYFKTIAEYYYRLEAADRKELEKLRKEKENFENEYRVSLRYKQHFDEKHNEFPWSIDSIDRDKEVADYFYDKNDKRYNELSQKIGYYSDRINTSKYQQQKAIQAFKIFDEVGLMFMDRDSKRKLASNARLIIEEKNREIKEYDGKIEQNKKAKEEIKEAIKITNAWKYLNAKKADSLPENDRQPYQDEIIKLENEIISLKKRLKLIDSENKKMENYKHVAQYEITKTQECLPLIEEEIQRKSAEIKSFYPKMEEFYKNNIEEWQYS